MTPRGSGRRAILAVAAYLAYFVAYFPLVALFGPSAAALVLVPTLVAGLLLGARGACWSGLAAAPVNHALVAASLGEPWLAWRASEIFYIPLTIGIGIVVGSLVDMRERLHIAIANEEASRAAALANTEALRASEERLRAIVDHTPATVVLTDLDGRVTFVNRHDDAPLVFKVGDLAHSALPSPDADEVARAIERATAGNAENLRVPVGDRWLSIRAGPVVHMGAHAGAIVLLSDVTALKCADDARRRSEQLASLGTLVAGVAHEINNPLTYIRGSADLATLDLQDARASADVQKIREAIDTAIDDLRVISRGTDRIAHITQTLRRVAEPNTAPRISESLSEIADGVMTVVASKLPTEIALDVDLRSQRAIPLAEGDISQVMLHLVLNAVDAVGGRRDGRVQVRTRDESSAAVFEVKDNGPGIAPEIQAQLFTPFLTTKDDGTGLGLSISRRIAEDHGGELTYDSTRDGTTFRLRLPVPLEAQDGR